VAGVTQPRVVLRCDVGLKPTIPFAAAGPLPLPPISVPIENGTHLEATSAPSPPELPLTVLALSYGFLPSPNILLSVCPVQQN
jgi:hypothetical protein